MVQSGGKPVRLNFGAGDPAPGWLNLDASPVYALPRLAHGMLAALGVSRQSRLFRDARYHRYRLGCGRPLPIETGSMEAVYASHVLEHLPAELIPALFDEFHRVLKTGGVARVIVPDLSTQLANVSAETAWVSLEDALETIPAVLRNRRVRSALEGLFLFPSMHRTLVNAENLQEALAPRWRLSMGMSYGESEIDAEALSQVEREARCRDALIFEATPLNQ